ncbi:2-succinyl-6-hydroxy-2, 4-cyclohexadiene-1-carboxylate synthase [Escherichia coli]|uniref:2-succinyl-6-hydroxy-2, 4-cyclohexadiene-1-carboxylate synthase n=1 Tax=Escherichia coli TaxID=562 RepID=A0A376Y6T0_ECOLX|nr:2-succinyl-6-hydroxy-2, 4-cyclohexadiene-1-carboxylate synthase [Escherichia coli]
MMAACQGLAGLCGVIVEGGHPGLQNAEQRADVSVPIANGCSVFSQNR